MESPKAARHRGRKPAAVASFGLAAASPAKSRSRSHCRNPACRNRPWNPPEFIVPERPKGSSELTRLVSFVTIENVTINGDFGMSRQPAQSRPTMEILELESFLPYRL